MTHSILTNSIQITSDSSVRTSGIDRFIVHHAATTSLAAILSLFQPGGRTVSANYALGSDGTLVLTVDEDRRAWTSSSSYWDGRAVTIEVANSYAGDPWPVSDAAFDKLARLIADVATRYHFPINDDTILTHQELYIRYGDSYATACPGDLQRRKAELLDLARKYQSSGTAGGNVTPIGRKRPMYSIIPEANSDAVWVQSLVTGKRALIRNPYDLGLLQRVRNNDNNDEMLVGEMDIVKGYLTTIAPSAATVDTAALAKSVSDAVIASINATGVEVDEQGVAAAVDAVLADNFAAIPKAVTEEIGS